MQNAVAETVPFLRDRVQELNDWSTIKLLTVKIDRLKEWFLQERVLGAVLRGDEKTSMPLPLQALRRWPLLRRIPARVIGIGFRVEHVQTREQ
jgi:hypothetical protein